MAAIMKHLGMTDRKKEKAVAIKSSREQKTDGAFDLWLQRGLHQLFDEVAREPIPDELLKIIEDDRDKT